MCCQIDVNPFCAGQSRYAPPPLSPYTTPWLMPLKQLKAREEALRGAGVGFCPTDSDSELQEHVFAWVHGSTDTHGPLPSEF